MTPEESERLFQMVEEARRLNRHSRVLTMTVLKMCVDRLKDNQTDLVIEVLSGLHDYMKHQLADQ